MLDKRGFRLGEVYKATREMQELIAAENSQLRSTHLPSKTVLLPLQKRCWWGLGVQFWVSEDLWQQLGTLPVTARGGIGGLLLPCRAQRSRLAAKHPALHTTAQQSRIQPRVSVDPLRRTRYRTLPGPSLSSRPRIQT